MKMIFRYKRFGSRVSPDRIKILVGLLLMLTGFTNCNKLVEIPEPVTTITTPETFSTDANATSAIIAIYSQMSYNSGTMSFSNGATTMFAALSADELVTSYGSTYELNDIQSTDGYIKSGFWSKAYSSIYQTNAAIENLNKSAINEDIRNGLLGEAKFLRALAYFYLVNLFGDVPLVLTTDFATSSLLPRSPVDKVYEQIIADLKDAQNLLPSDYDSFNDHRTRANKFAAMALFARVNLYQGNWQDAASLAKSVIDNTSLFSLPSDVNTVFLQDSREAILQLEVVNNYPWATWEGQGFIPYNNAVIPDYFLSNTLLSAFEPNDARLTAWVGISESGGTNYYYPFKYKVRQGSPDNITENYMVLRLAEQYLIAAEAEANGANGGIDAAIADLNKIRERAGLPDYTGDANKDSVLQAIYHERQVELFMEWGHRWLDLKRWKTATQVLSANKGRTITADKLLFPIPLTELQADPNLTQNPGY